MIEWFYQAELLVAVVGGVLALLLGLIGRLPSLVSLVPLLVTALNLIIQAFITIGVLVSGGKSAGDPIDDFGRSKPHRSHHVLPYVANLVWVRI